MHRGEARHLVVAPETGGSTRRRGRCRPDAGALDLVGILVRPDQYAALEREAHHRALVRGLAVGDLSEIVRGLFQSAYVGYYAFSPHAGAGYMAEGLELTLAFLQQALGEFHITFLMLENRLRFGILRRRNSRIIAFAKHALLLLHRALRHEHGAGDGDDHEPVGSGDGAGAAGGGAPW